ncbi:MAG TPA: C4-dicarboxylate ABC transporter substrate-binding protein, partial [Anaerolineae bacterium]|nr:C4-dicarboxylate ABC transporter substrate-binding protein [Anaerolineae bacterium]
MKALLKIADIIDGLTEWVGGLANWIVVIVILVGFFNVVARYLGRFVGTRLTSNVFIELQWYLFSLI